MVKSSKSFRLSDSALANLKVICKASGVNETAALEMALAALAKGLTEGEKMKAIINGTKETVTGKSLDEIRRKMNSMLKIDGPRALTAQTDNGAKIHVELYDGKDYVRTSDGRQIYP